MVVRKNGGFLGVLYFRHARDASSCRWRRWWRTIPGGESCQSPTGSWQDFGNGSRLSPLRVDWLCGTEDVRKDRRVGVGPLYKNQKEWVLSVVGLSAIGQKRKLIGTAATSHVGSGLSPKLPALSSQVFARPGRAVSVPHAGRCAGMVHKRGYVLLNGAGQHDGQAPRVLSRGYRDW